jgi:hypothetical protein
MYFVIVDQDTVSLYENESNTHTYTQTHFIFSLCFMAGSSGNKRIFSSRAAWATYMARPFLKQTSKQTQPK